MEPVPVLVVPGRLLLLRMRGDQRRVDVDRQPLRRAVQLPEPRPRPGVRVTDASSSPGVDAIRSTVRNAVESDATDPNSDVLITDRAQVRDALAAVGEHHREIADHPTRVMTTTPLLDARQTHRQRAREPQPCPRPAPAARSPRATPTPLRPP